MRYEFPVITHIDQVLAAIEGRDEFIVKHDVENGYKVVNYLVNYENTFPPVENEQHAILRECRGITFCDKTGKVLSRKFHKFFNSGEKSETKHEAIDWTKPHMLLEKLDGSMITFLIINGELRACTKMGLTDIAKQVDGFIELNPYYKGFIYDAINNGLTVIFEWCSRKQRIVVDYPVDRLVLTAIRDNITGKYSHYDFLSEMARANNIDYVKPHSGEIQEGEEGYIVRFDDGHMLKVKGEWYVQLHKTLDHLRHEKDVIRLIVDERLDDAKGFLPADLSKAADDFGQQIFTNVRAVASDIFWTTRAAYDNLNGSKKRFAIEVANGNPNAAFMFKIFDNLEEGEEFAYKLVLNCVRDHTSSQGKVNSIRRLIGEKSWYDYVSIKEE